MIKLLFIDGTAGFSPDRLATRPCGGIITSLTKIPQYLASRGLDVHVCSAHATDEVVNGVRYSQQLDIDPDIVIFNRNMMNRQLVNLFPKAKKMWWLHDIVDHKYMEDDAFKYMDKIVSLSDYCTASYSDYFDLDRRLFAKIPNGVDKAVFNTENVDRNRNLFLMASAPIKGMYPIDFTWYNLKRNNPNAELRLYCSQKLHDMEELKSTEKMVNHLRHQDVTILAPITQEQLAETMKQAWAFLMPNHYPEICSNVLLQARACGLPVIASDIGSADEFIEHGLNGLLTKTKPHDMYWWHKDFAELTVRLSGDPILHDRLSFNSPKGVFSWEEIGDKWYNLIGEIHGNNCTPKVSEKLHV